MKSIVCAHPGRICQLAPESWFFGDMFRPGLRNKLSKFGNLMQEQNVERLIDYMYSKSPRGSYWSMLGGEFLDIPRNIMSDLVKNSARTEREIYDAIIRAPLIASHGLEAAQDAAMGEKMPGNLYYVPKIKTWYPDAYVIHTFRDPRAILASEWRKNVQAGRGVLDRIIRPIKSLAVVMYITVTWLYAVRLHKRYSRKYSGRYKLVCYEKLLDDSESTVRDLCKFLEFDFDPAMLQPAKYGSSFSTEKGQGFDRQGVDRWRDHLAPWMHRWVNFVAGSRLAEFDYKP